MKALTENTDFVVIAAIGMAGSGKSFILNELAGYQNSSEDNGPALRPFVVQTQDIMLEGSHQTVGVDMYITGERIILLDCQPVCSSSVVLDMVLEGAPLPAIACTYDHLMDIQLMMFILAISHVVIVTQPNVPPSRPLLSVLRSAHWLWMPPEQLDEEEEEEEEEEESGRGARQGSSEKHAAPGNGKLESLKQDVESLSLDPRGGGTFLKGAPHIVFVHNMIPDSSLTVLSQRRIETVVHEHFRGTGLFRHAQHTSYRRVKPLNGRKEEGEDEGSVSSPVNCYLLPIDEDSLQGGMASLQRRRAACSGMLPALT
ncbi:hypothetical protein GUITHDRAFT_147103 [Guillardia theta CCMP2712]|uniref:Protein SMG9 n=1 Tax=Guillardia theta (strain CCMP2712) TaxID=905079 RepID=L1IE84_GUITC|nr:hypothetical protein GUITHDRAFT_147103 [Guillardia theta CCMP2712]EKX34581.1 hypothetical protein GUITHDRAFT_147103 [Guillardia theta CCMP2712]|eukprot:XP_005821561.1 hypothetical protein GUITHDRAFT_147103 [Guillardia theta CCMP2712]